MLRAIGRSARSFCFSCKNGENGWQGRLQRLARTLARAAGKDHWNGWKMPPRPQPPKGRKRIDIATNRGGNRHDCFTPTVSDLECFDFSAEPGERNLCKPSVACGHGPQ